MSTRKILAKIAKEKALLPLHGFINGQQPNIKPLVALFPKWNIVDADKLWCAAFVYYCTVEAGFEIPYSPDECETCSLAGCGGWEEFAVKDERITYFKRNELIPEVGDIVIYDYVFCNKEHDHIGIVLEVSDTFIITAEGNYENTNQSAIVKRPLDEHIRGFIRIPDNYKYKTKI